MYVYTCLYDTCWYGTCQPVTLIIIIVSPVVMEIALILQLLRDRDPVTTVCSKDGELIAQYIPILQNNSPQRLLQVTAVK